MRHRWAEPLLRAVLRASPYPLVLLGTTVALRSRGPEAFARAVAWLSTDLRGLADHPVPALIGSALVAEEDLVAWTALAWLGLAVAVARDGAARPLLAALAVHLVASLGSQALVAVRIARGALPDGARVMTDVGPSYVVVALLVLGVVRAGRWARVGCAGALAVVAPSLLAGLGDLDVAAVGHVLSAGAAAVTAMVWRYLERGEPREQGEPRERGEPGERGARRAAPG